MDSEPQRYVLTVDEVAERLRIHRNTVLDMIHEGAFRARLAGRSWRIPVAAFGEFLAGRDNPEKVLSMDELAAALAVHRNTATAMVQAGTIRAGQPGTPGEGGRRRKLTTELKRPRQEGEASGQGLTTTALRRCKQWLPSPLTIFPTRFKSSPAM